MAYDWTKAVHFDLNTSLTDYIVLRCTHYDHDWDESEVKRWDTYSDGSPGLDEINRTAQKHWDNVHGT